MSTPASFKKDEWEVRLAFITRIEKICQQEDVSLLWLCDSWVARLEKKGQVKYLYAYRFPLNDAVASSIATDKVATYELLKHNHIPAVPHALVRIAGAKSSIDGFSLPCVVKPCSRGGGVDVYKATTPAELSVIIQKMSTRYSEIAVSPFEKIIGEYRVVIFDNAAPLIFRKVPIEGEWRHNLAFSAAAEPIKDSALKAELGKLGRQAAATLGLRFTAIDCITTDQGIKVLEVNAGFSLNKLGESFDKTVNAIYRSALLACFGGSR